MFSWFQKQVFRLLIFLTLLGSSASVQAGLFCSDFDQVEPPSAGNPGAYVIDGTRISGSVYNLLAGGTTAWPTQITVDANCTFQNFVSPNDLDVTINFQTPAQGAKPVYLVVFDNVSYTGNMACANIDHRIWLVNGSSTDFSSKCQDLFIPVEAITKQNPTGKTSVGIGEVFNYTLTIPVLYDPATGTVISNSGTNVDVHTITVVDDLNATGANLTVVGTPSVTYNGFPLNHTYTNNAGVLTFIIDPAFVLPAGDQIFITIPVVVDNTNVVGTQFNNTASWTFGRVILLDLNGDGIFEPVFFDPLPGENGVTPPLTIGAPYLAMDKRSLDTTLSPGSTGSFTLDVQNTGTSTAFQPIIVDRLPQSGTASMCGTNPASLPVTAGIYQADGVTLVQSLSGTNFSVSFNPSAAPAYCELTFNFNSNVAIASGQRLLINYQASLEPGASVNGELLVNIAGVTQWFSGDGSYPRTTFNNSLTDGTPAINTDYQDSFNVTVGLAPYYFQKTVTNLTTGATPAVTAVAGETLRYTLRVFNVSTSVTGVNISDNLDSLRFDLNSFSLVSATAGAVVNFNAGTGLLTINGGAGSLNVAQGTELRVVFDIDTLPTLTDGSTVSNQALLSTTSGYSNVLSDDPYLNGADDPTITPPVGDPTNVTVYRPGPLSKTNGPVSAVIGETFTYTIRVPATPVATPLYDVRILDALGVDSNGNPTVLDVSYVSATGTNANSGTINWILSNTGTASSPVIEDLVSGIDIPANDQAVITITVRLDNTTDNQIGSQFYNTADYTYNRRNNDASTRTAGSGVTTITPTTIYEPSITSITKVVDNATPQAGQNVHYTVTLTAQSGANVSDVFDVLLVDQLPLGLRYVANSATLNTVGGISENVIGDGLTTAQTVTWGVANDIDIPAGTTITFEYDVQVVLLITQPLVNSVHAEWTSTDGNNGFERNGTDGVGGVLNDYATAPATASLIATIPALTFEKSVINLTSGQNPGANAQPGDTLQYTLHIQNTTQAALLGFTLQDELDALNSNPAFVPGSLLITSVLPVGAVDISNVNGGTNGTGLIDISNLDLTADDGAPGGTDEITITFTAQLVPIIANATQVLNQANIISQASIFQSSDDPNIGGMADPTLTTITSAPSLEVFKTSQDITGASNILLPGDTLRYTITVRNIGNDNAINAVLSDFIPANTTYVANSTYLNGVLVADVNGASALEAGMLINSPDTVTSGYLTADASIPVSNEATIIFDVVINAGVSDGVIISNQGFVSTEDGGGAAIALVPSDDPATTLLDDPTLNIVGSVPWLDAQKTVQLIDNGTTPNIVDPNDTLRYTIIISNRGGVDATNVTFTDAVPVSTTYVSNTVFLNGLPVSQPDGGVSPLMAGIPVSSSDLTTITIPTAGNGVLTAGGSATIIFDVTVDAVAPGTLISNQGVVSSNEQMDEPTDADGDDTNGDQPTVVVVGNTQQLSITKQVFVVGGGMAAAGGELEYVIRATNISSVPATNVVIIDNLDAPIAGYKTYIAGSALMNGLATGVNYAAPVLSADYGVTYGDLDPGNVVELRFRVVLNATLPIGTTVTNTSTVYWNAMTQNASASVSLDIGGTPGTINLNGTVWHDADFDETLGSGETTLSNWRVDLYQNSVLLHTAYTDVNGVYQFAGLLENYLVTTPVYELRFSAPGSTATSASMGLAYSGFTNDQQRITDIRGASGASLQNLSLPIQPNGMVYDSILRTPIAGAVIEMVNAVGATLPASCFNDPNQQNQTTLASGFYKFDLNFSQIECPLNSNYSINVYPPAGYIDSDNNPATPETSVIIPPQPGVYDAVSCLNDAVAATTECEIQASIVLPPATVPPRTALTDYYKIFTFGNSPREQIYNNHIPLDSSTLNVMAISKTTSMVNVNRSQLVPYTITLSNTFGVPLYDINIVDTYPAGFKYVRNSARIYVNNVRASGNEEPQINGQQMIWPNRVINNDETTVIKMLLVVSGGVGEGEYINRVQAINSISNGNTSGEATATVRVVPDPTFDCTDIIGKVYDDKNMNGYPDEGEPGIAGARVATAQGLEATTDKYGRYHFTCALVPNQDRGSNFIIKLDERSLPVGYRVTSENPRTQRATRGKMLKYNFGAAIHHVIRLDMMDAVFKPGTTDVRAHWVPRFDLLITELAKDQSVLRLAYLAENEDPSLVNARLEAMKAIIENRWAELNCCYRLTIETEVYWRKGGPVDKGALH